MKSDTAGADAIAEYVEEVALFFERSGVPRIAGRILGLLLVCDPPARSAVELSEELGVSKASVSTMTRLLVRTGLLERVPAPGARATYFRLREDGFEKLFAAKMEGMVAFRPLAERGLRLLPPDPEPRRRLRLLKALYAFFEREMPALLERWRAEREALVAEDEA